MTLHRFDDIEQRSEEWYEVRRGIVTASAVGQLVTVGAPDPLTVDCPTCNADAGSMCFSMARRKEPAVIKTVHDGRVARAADEPPVYTVARNDTSRSLTALLATERITGWTDPTYVSDDMIRGVEYEPVARAAYAEHYADVTEVGFMRRDEDGWRLGWSPDGLVGDDGAVEIKCPRAKTHVRTILADEVPAQYVPQCQAALLVSGREWIDFVSYVSGLPLFVKRVHPDPAWHAAITAACRAFETNAAQIVADYSERVKGLPKTERVDFEVMIG